MRRAGRLRSAVPHWPAPDGWSAGAVEQRVVEQELASAGITRPSYGITGWVVLTVLQHGTQNRVAGNESVSLGGGDLAAVFPVPAIVEALDAHPERLAGREARVGAYAARAHAISVLNLRSAHRAVGEPGPEAAVTTLELSELLHDAGELMTALAGPDAAFVEGAGATAAMLVLPRDPLVR